MKKINLIVVGKLKDSSLEKIENEYLKRLQTIKLNIIELKSQCNDQDILNKIEQLTKGSSSYLVALTENGKSRDSVQFSKWLHSIIETKQEKLFFIIGGAAGFSPEFLNKIDETISLSPLTFPHKIARILFVEQTYRAESIYNGHPYHK